MREIEPTGDGSNISNMSTSSSSDHICRRSAEGTLERGTEESSALFCLCRHHPFLYTILAFPLPSSYEKTSWLELCRLS
ncbi:MAG: hypothetical protein M3264_02640 [Thermoproteota archaeon]|nr:hypothetical protein [Thermoproteota archaeon]